MASKADHQPGPATADALVALVDTAEAIGLADLDAVASLQTRVDRKYLVRPAVITSVLAERLPRIAVLEIAGRRQARYASTYFDTPALDSFHSAATRRRHRFKVRTRAYLDSDLCFLELKVRGGRGQTVKIREPYPIACRDSLTAGAQAVVDERLGRPGLGARLGPTLTTHFQRATILDGDGTSRYTIDHALACTAPGDQRVDLPGWIVIETKSLRDATPLDRSLWRRGIRPVPVSKFAIGLTALDPTLPANKWNRVLRDHFGWEPATDGAPPNRWATRFAGGTASGSLSQVAGGEA